MRRLCKTTGALVLAGMLTVICCAHAWSEIYHVAVTGSDTNSGTLPASPFRTVQKAVDQAGPGDTVFVGSGTYREYVVPPRGGVEGQYLEISGYSNGWPIIKGSDIVTNWTNYSNAIWKTENWILNSQQVFDNGRPLRQVGWPNDYFAEEPQRYPSVLPGFSDMTNNTFYYDASALCLYIWLDDSGPPSGRVIEVSVRLQLLNGASTCGGTNGFFYTKNLQFMNCNTVAHSPNGWPGVMLGSHSVVENCRIQWCDASAYAVYENSQVVNSDISNNGRMGLGSSMTNILVKGCTISSNNYRGFSEHWSAAGMKVISPYSPAGGTIEDCDIGWNYGFGIWFDTCTNAVDIVVRNNYIHDNGLYPGHTLLPAAVMMEVTRGARIYNNVIVSNNGFGCWIAASDDIKFYNNTLLGNTGFADIRIGDLPRRLPDENWASLKGNEIINNIVVDSDCKYTLTMPPDSTNVTTCAAGNTSDYNCYYNSTGRYAFALNGVTVLTSVAEWQAFTGWDSNSIADDPALESGSLYALAEGSPAVDSGVGVSGVSSDYYGIPRPLDGDTNGVAGMDIGAHEFIHPAGDTDNDGLLDTGEVARGSSPINPDTDADGMNDGDETKAGTDPLDPDSLFRVLGAENLQDTNAFVVSWSSVTDVYYGIDAVTNLGEEFFELTGGVAGVPPENSYTDFIGGITQRFYRVRVEP
jgi:parallel beta-helix repeat protein